MLPPDDYLEQYRQYVEQYQQWYQNQQQAPQLFDNRVHNYTYTPCARNFPAPNHNQPYQGGYYNYPYQYAYGYQYSAQLASPTHGQYYSYCPYYPYCPCSNDTHTQMQQTPNYGYNHAFMVVLVRKPKKTIASQPREKASIGQPAYNRTIQSPTSSSGLRR